MWLCLWQAVIWPWLYGRCLVRIRRSLLRIWVRIWPWVLRQKVRWSRGPFLRSILRAWHLPFQCLQKYQDWCTKWLFQNIREIKCSRLVPILLRKSAIFWCPLCAQLFLCLCFPKVMIFDFHLSTMNDDLYGQVESKSSLWYKNQTIWLKNG